jgi:hypothetical protein
VFGVCNLRQFRSSKLLAFAIYAKSSPSSKLAFAIYANFDEGELVEMPIELLKYIAWNEYIEQFEGRQDRATTDIESEERQRHQENGVSMANIN